MQRTVRYQAAIIRSDHVLLLKVADHVSGRTFWLIPGGGREPDETEEECIQREVREETHLHVEVDGMILDEQAPPGDMYQRCKTYLCQAERSALPSTGSSATGVVAGEPRPGSEPEVDTADHATIREVRWFDLCNPTTWDSLMLNDPITYPFLQRLRSALGYATEEVARS